MSIHSREMEVIRNGVKPGRVHDPRSTRHRDVVVREVHPIDELGLPTEVEIVGPHLRTRRDKWFPVTKIGPDGGDDHPSPRSNGPQ